jgi:hypothetical protein
MAKLYMVSQDSSRIMSGKVRSPGTEGDRGSSGDSPHRLHVEVLVQIQRLSSECVRSLDLQAMRG